MKVHLFVISWQGKRDFAEKIVSQCTEADYRTVVYSNAAESAEEGTGNWLQVPNNYFFGRKFKAALDVFEPDADVFLLVQADADCVDWNQLIRRCKIAFALDRSVGVWAPHVHHSWWINERVVMGQTTTGSIVAQTDGITFAFRRSTVERLRQLDYNCNNLGWGVEWAAIAHAWTENRLAYRDQTVKVLHPEGSGYDHTDARQQQAAFLGQLSDEEITRVIELYRYVTQPHLRISHHGAP